MYDGVPQSSAMEYPHVLPCIHRTYYTRFPRYYTEVWSQAIEANNHPADPALQADAQRDTTQVFRHYIL